jgi:hypothetical protein
MPPLGFEPTISACERPKTYALDRAATGTDMFTHELIKYEIHNKNEYNFPESDTVTGG